MPKVVPEAALTKPCPWEHMGTSYDDRRRRPPGDPPPDPRLAGLQRLCNGCEDPVHTYLP